MSKGTIKPEELKPITMKKVSFREFQRMLRASVWCRYMEQGRFDKNHTVPTHLPLLSDLQVRLLCETATIVLGEGLEPKCDLSNYSWTKKNLKSGYYYLGATDKQLYCLLRLGGEYDTRVIIDLNNPSRIVIIVRRRIGEGKEESFYSMWKDSMSLAIDRAILKETLANL